jgi:hypothetical protein
MIVSPMNGLTVRKGGSLLLHVLGRDLEDGEVAPDRIQWRSSRDGVLGTGARLVAKLSPGKHKIIVRATDREGMRGEAAVLVVVK